MGVIKSVVGNILHSNDPINPLRAMTVGSMRNNLVKRLPSEPTSRIVGSAAKRKSNIAGMRI